MCLSRRTLRSGGGFWPVPGHRAGGLKRPGWPRKAGSAGPRCAPVSRGWPVRVSGVDGTLDLLAIETADDPRLAAFDPDAKAAILLSGGRAATLKLANQADAAAPDRPVLVARVPWLDLPAAHALADPALDLATPLKGPFHAAHCDAADAASGALELARLAGLRPAFFCLNSNEGGG